MTKLRTLPKRWTYEEYYASTDEWETYEIIDGVPLLTERSKETLHQEWLGNLMTFLHPHIEKHKLGELCLGPLDVVFDPENVVQPDFLFVSASRKSILQHRGVFGSPDAMFEIISPVTFARDRYQKVDLYAKFGVQEYWIIDPRNCAIEILLLDAGRYKLHSSAAETGALRSQVLRFEFDISQMAGEVE